MKLLLVSLVAPLAILTAPVAAADINFSGINVPIGNGHAESTIGNVAVALNGGTAVANGGVFNVAVATGPSFASTQNGSFNLVTATGNKSSVQVVDSNFNVFSATRGGQITGVSANGTLNRSAGSSTTKPSTISVQNTDLSVQVALCGGSVLSAQGDRINVGAPCIGIGH